MNMKNQLMLIRKAVDHVGMAMFSLGEAANLLQEAEEHTATNSAALLHEQLKSFREELERFISCVPSQQKKQP